MIVADRKLLLISLPVCAGHIVCRCNLQAYLLQTFCIKPMFCKSVSVPNMSMFVHKRDQSKNVALKPKYRSKRLLMGSWFIFNWFSCPSEGWLAICNIYIYPGPTWGIWSDRQLLILSSERVAGDGLEWREATNWKLCGKNKPGLTVGLMLWLTWKRKTRDKRRRSRRLLITRYSKQISEGWAGGFVCEGFDGSMTLFEIVDVIGDGAHWDLRDDNLHSFVFRWGGGHYTRDLFTSPSPCKTH